jgi:hypothetical protein
MFKKLFTAVVIATSVGATAQTGQLDQIKDIPESTLWKAYYITSVAGGKTTVSAYDTKYQMQHVNNIHGKLSAFNMVKEGTSDFSVNYGFGWLEPNHYTQPSMFVAENNDMAWLYLDGILYGLEDVDSFDQTDITVKYIYIPLDDKKSEEGGEKKKTSLKEKMAAAKNYMKTAGIPAKVTDTDHEKVVEDYLKSMVPVQQEATAAFSAEIKNEIAAIQQAKDDEDAEIKATNDAYWASEEGQRKLGEMKQEPTVLVNDTGAPFWICYGSGVSTLLDPGESETFSYSTGGNVYMGHSIPNNTSQAEYDFDDLMLDTRLYSGKTVNISTVLPKK